MALVLRADGLGFNYRMTDIHAALGASQMQRMDGFLARRHQLADRYDRLLAGAPVEVRQGMRKAPRHGTSMRCAGIGAIGHQPAAGLHALRDAGIGVNVLERLMDALSSLKADPPRLASMSRMVASSSTVRGRGDWRRSAPPARDDAGCDEPRIVKTSGDGGMPISCCKLRKTPGCAASWPEHRTWFEATLNDPNRHVLIGEVDGETVGVLRFDTVEDEATVSVYLTAPGLAGGWS